MAKKDKDVVVVPEDDTPVDYSTMSKDELLEAIGEAYARAKAGDKPTENMKLMGILSKLHTKKEVEEEKSKKEALLTELVQKTSEVRVKVKAMIDKMAETGELDGAEGIWFAYDFGEIREVGINPSCRLVKSGRKASGEGGGSGKSSYVANPAKSADLLAQVGDNVYFKEDTTVTIDKVEQKMPAGMTFKKAYDFSTNGGWRNRVRMALLKEAGII